MKLVRSLWSLAFVVLLNSCGSGGGGDPVVENPSGCNSYRLGIEPVRNASYLCGAPGQATIRVINELNAFWGSDVTACACQADALAAGCQMNAFVLPTDVGYIYYDREFANQLDLAGGTMTGADWLMAHEFGHNVQLGLQLFTFGKQRELQADCLAGYFLGSLVCTDEIDEQDIMSAFSTVCGAGDPFVSPWWQDGAHGTCFERVGAVQQGIHGYLANALPGETCP